MLSLPSFQLCLSYAACPARPRAPGGGVCSLVAQSLVPRSLAPRSETPARPLARRRAPLLLSPKTPAHPLARGRRQRARSPALGPRSGLGRTRGRPTAAPCPARRRPPPARRRLAGGASCWLGG